MANTYRTCICIYLAPCRWSPHNLEFWLLDTLNKIFNFGVLALEKCRKSRFFWKVCCLCTFFGSIGGTKSVVRTIHKHECSTNFLGSVSSRPKLWGTSDMEPIYLDECRFSCGLLFCIFFCCCFVWFFFWLKKENEVELKKRSVPFSDVVVVVCSLSEIVIKSSVKARAKERATARPMVKLANKTIIIFIWNYSCTIHNWWTTESTTEDL